jgi:hypothetical protein
VGGGESSGEDGGRESGSSSHGVGESQGVEIGSLRSPSRV